MQADGDPLPDVVARIARARTRADKLRNVWSAALPCGLKLRLYVSAVCSIMTYGSEAWLLNEQTCKKLNGTNATMLAYFTGKSIQEEATTETTTLDILSWIRARRLQWCDHILRLPEHRLVHQAL